MSAVKKIPRPRSINNRQRQRLIDACISALHTYGPSRTTVEKVVAIAKMSPGIVRFYFDSKASMLVASLQFLAMEFEEQVLAPVAQLKNRPVLALESLVRLYLDPAIASTRKVSVWYSFWGEASSRQEYYDICGQKDESFAVLVHELIQRLIQDSQQTHLDADGISLGLIGVLEILWQNFAFQAEKNIDRVSAQKRAMAYLSSVFPSQFTPHVPQPPHSSGGVPLHLWAFRNARLAEIEKDRLFRSSSQIIGLESALIHPGDYVAVALATERALIVKNQQHSVQALRNNCPVTPHTLVPDNAGHLDGAIRCPVHDLTFDLTGQAQGEHPHLDLTRVELHRIERFLAIGADAVGSAATATRAWFVGRLPANLRSLELPHEYAINADWKTVVEDWLTVVDSEFFQESDLTIDPLSNSMAWQANLKPAKRGSARCYGKIVGHLSKKWYRFFSPPNQLFELRPDGLTIAQVRPTSLGNCTIRLLNFTQLELSKQRQALIARYLGTRLSATLSLSARRRAHSVQNAITEFGYPVRSQNLNQAVSLFRHYVIQHIPELNYRWPPA